MNNKYWYNKIFQEEITEEYKTEIIKELKEEFQKFYKEYDDFLCYKNSEKLNKWYYSEKGQEELLRFINDFWIILTKNASDAMPAHDARHALFKVPAYAIKYIYSEKVKSWERVGIIGALGHDFGRWTEERIFGNAQGGSAHSRMSYVLLKEIIEDYNIPYELQQNILHSVLKHTTGANDDESMPIKLTVSPDRDQLVGPEMILRIFHHKPKEHSMKVIFDEENQESVISAIIKMYFSRLPGPLYSLSHELRESYKITLTFVLANTSLDKIKEYHKKYATSYFQEIYFNEDIEFATKEIQKMDNNNLNVEDVMLTMLSFKNVCPKEEYKLLALDKLKILSESQKNNLAKSLNWVNEKRNLLDLEQYKFFKNFQSNIDDKWLKHITNKLVENWL